MKFKIETCSERTPKDYFPKCEVISGIVKTYYLEVETLDDLLKLKKKTGHGIIMETVYDDILRQEIEMIRIYDGWNE